MPPFYSSWQLLVQQNPKTSLTPGKKTCINVSLPIQWEASGALECMTLDGEKRYFRNAGPNLFRVDSACYKIKAAKDGVSFSGSE